MYNSEGICGESKMVTVLGDSASWYLGSGEKLRVLGLGRSLESLPLPFMDGKYVLIRYPDLSCGMLII